MSILVALIRGFTVNTRVVTYSNRLLFFSDVPVAVSSNRPDAIRVKRGEPSPLGIDFLAEV